MTKQTAAVLAGHGSLHSDSGQAMMDVAASLRTQGIVPFIAAGFLNFSQPTIAEAVAEVVRQGATNVIIQPYFLIEGHYVRNDLRQTVRDLAATYHPVLFTMGEVFGDHVALFTLACKRLSAVSSQREQSMSALPAAVRAATGLLFVAHGTPVAEANAPILRLLQRVADHFGYGQAAVGYLDCNEPDIPTAFDQLVATGIQRLLVLPYFLHLGRHVRRDLPALFAAARDRYGQVDIQIAHHLDYDPLLVQAAAERIMSSMMCEGTR